MQIFKSFCEESNLWYVKSFHVDREIQNNWIKLSGSNCLDQIVWIKLSGSNYLNQIIWIKLHMIFHIVFHLPISFQISFHINFQINLLESLEIVKNHSNREKFENLIAKLNQNNKTIKCNIIFYGSRKITRDQKFWIRRFRMQYHILWIPRNFLRSKILNS